MSELPPAEDVEEHANQLRLLAEACEEIADEHEKAYDQCDSAEEMKKHIDAAIEGFDDDKLDAFEKFL